jgi:hypothetical protein
MNARTLLAAAVAAAMMTMTVSLFAAETPTPAGKPAAKSEPIYGYGMMTDAERNEFRGKMRNAKSEQERQSLRDDHRKAMEARAKERGVTLPEQRGPRSDGTGPGYGPGGGKDQGSGPGAGKGPGYGPGGGKGPGYGPGAGKGVGPEGKGPGYGPGAGKGQGPEGKGPGYGPGARGECPAGQEGPGPGAGKGPGPRP